MSLPDFAFAPPGTIADFASPVGPSWRSDLIPLLAAADGGVRTSSIMIVAGELIANAREHGGGVLGLRVSARSGCLTVEVDDPDRSSLPRMPNSGDSDRGRGLSLVAALSAAWGWRCTPAGKTVWAEIGTDPEGGEPA